ncbi:RidA family protein [Tenacibaculum aiptasiae]|uniref:RidA family protein n=1 Tax=Tenacibaculum aiptasiae TaxID=426481 RepID=A0A7J5A9G6_9FLAO|nr:RidA family protein [Tenacibaculum aiptasiae]KAB1154204.1 RidA family protein [Tenacibaculum aiptasiae]
MKHLTLLIATFIFTSCVAQQNTTNLKRKNPKSLYNPTQYGFTQTINAPANGEYIFVSGQLGTNEELHEFSKDFRTQVKLTLQNVIHGLKANKVNTKDVVKITVLIKDHSNKRLKIWTEEMLKVWGNKYPTSTLIPVPRLALDGMLIEVDAIAYKTK